MPEYLNDQIRAVEQAFQKHYEANQPKPKNTDKANTAVPMSYAYPEKIADDHVIFNKDGQYFRLDYTSADGYDVEFADVSKAKPVKSTFVPDKGSLVDRAKKYGRVGKDGRVPKSTLKEMAKKGDKATRRKATRKLAGSGKGAYG